MATTPTSDLTSYVDVESIPWADFGDGIEVKVLRIGAADGVNTVVTRFAPGVQLPTHKHFGPVHAYTISGRWHYLEYPWVAEAGSFVHEPVGTVHTLRVPDDNTEPTVVFFTIANGMALLDEHGNPTFLQDGEGLAAFYRTLLEAQGIAWPDQILP